MTESTQHLASEFALPDSLRIESGANGRPCLTIESDLCTAKQYLLGSTVTNWQPNDQAHPVLFLSEHAVFREGKGIRGGVPICFPWFGAHPSDSDAASHGLVRGYDWNLKQTAVGSQSVDVDTVFHLDQLKAEFRTHFGRSLTMQLLIVNTSDTDQTFEAALHTYFTVGDVRQVEITGLENTPYYDTVGGGRTAKVQGEQPVTFDGEVDRIYQETEATCTLTDPSIGRRIKIEKLGSSSTVVWNPWIDRAKKFSDFGDDEWQRMCCIESANIAEHAVKLAPGENHTLRVMISVENL